MNILSQLFGNYLSDFIARILYFLPAAILSLPLHELAHGLVSYWCGDPTAKNAGRLSLNPLRHLDPVGFILLLFVGFGWAKPVPINPMYYKHRKRGIILVSLAGPFSNLLLAFVCYLVLTIFYPVMMTQTVLFYLAQFLYYMVMINISLAIFNLIPLPPLDGSKVLMCALPTRAAYTLSTLERYSFILIILLSLSGVLGYIINFFYRYIILAFQFLTSFLP